MALSESNADKLINRLDKLAEAIESQQESPASFARLDERLFGSRQSEQLASRDYCSCSAGFLCTCRLRPMSKTR